MEASADRHRLRQTFDRVPELYDRARPAYPDAIFDDIVSLAALPATGRVLELGVGTGQATVALADRGLSVVGLEPGAALATLARRKLAPYADVQVVNETFEAWEPDGSFDAVVAFTSFHWIDPEVRFAKAARVLRPGGALAVVQPHTVLNDDRFWIDVQEDYDAVVPSPDNGPPKRPDEIEDLGREIESSGLFRNVAARRHLWETHYTAREYVSLVSTYSPTLDLDEATRTRLLDRIQRRIERQGSMKMTYLFTLNVAQSTASSRPVRTS
jgi:SAM-dependent methyltransferase